MGKIIGGAGAFGVGGTLPKPSGTPSSTPSGLGGAGAFGHGTPGHFMDALHGFLGGYFGGGGGDSLAGRRQKGLPGPKPMPAIGANTTPISIGPPDLGGGMGNLSNPSGASTKRVNKSKRRGR